MSTDWERYQKCDVCDAPLGKPCIEYGGFDAARGVHDVRFTKAHSTRKLTAAAARAGGDR